MERQGHAEPVGLLLNLKKRKLFLTVNDTDNFDYLLFGNFDGISIKQAHSWYELAPTITMDESAADLCNHICLQTEPYISTFVLKLLFPKNISSNCLSGYNYGFWESSGVSDQNLKLYKGQPCPFFSIIMVNVSHSLAAHYSVQKQGTKKLFEYIANTIKKDIGSDFALLNCGLFESFGYYDYIILVRAPSFQPIINLCDTLKGLYFEGNPAISTCYTILGIDNWTKRGCCALPKGYAHTFREAAKEIERIEIALQFRPGCSDSNLCRLLQGEDVGLTIAEMRTHGNTDALLVINGEQLPKLLPQYLKSGHLNPGCFEYNTNVLSKNTTFLFHTRSLTPRTVHTGRFNQNTQNNGLSKESELLSPQYDAIFEQFREMRNRDQKSQRLTTALRQTVLRYRNLASGNHAFELRYFLKPIFDSLFENMERTMKLIDEIVQRSEAVDEEERLSLEWEQARYWRELECALRAFRESVGGFLSDIALSDKSFIEDSQLRHPPIGSATKLIFVYNLLVQQFAEALNQTKSQYSFLVKSGGSDDVNVSNLFNFLPLHNLGETALNENCLLVIELPERLLYNPRVSIFAILHETFHILGERNRKLRLQEMEAAVADSFAWLLTVLFSNPKALFKMLFDGEVVKGNAGEQKLRELIDQEMAVFRLQVSKEVLLAIQNEIGNPSNFDLFSRTIVDELIHAARTCLTPDLRCENQLFNAVYRLLHETYQRIGTSFREYDDHYIEIEFFIRLMSMFAGNGMERSLYDEHMNQRAFEALWQIFELACGNTVKFHLYNDRSYHEAEDQTVIAFIMQEGIRLEAVIDNCFSAMNETFSDCMAIKVLDMPLEDYCVCHCLMQEGTVSSILATCDETVLRVGCVLQYAYGIDNCFSDEEEQKIIDKIQSLNNAQAFSYPIDAACLIEQLKKLLRTCNESYGATCIKEHVVNYLDKTVEPAANEAQVHAGNILEVMRKIYKNWNPADIAKFQRLTLDQWLVIANPQQNGGTE